MTQMIRNTLVLILAFVAFANAATITVTSNADSGAGTLRAAVASAAAAGDIITFSGPMTINLLSTIALNKDLAISGDLNGNGLPDEITISGGYTQRIFMVSSTGTVNIQGLTLIRGFGYNGAAIYAGSTLAVLRCAFLDNNSGDNGGAIYSQGTLSLTETTFRNNSAYGGGGAVAISAASSRIQKVLFVNNTASSGGALFHFNTGRTTVQDSTFSSNKAITNSAGTFPRGGAVMGYGTSTINLIRCTVVQNTAQVGNGVYIDANAIFYTSGSLYSNQGDDISLVGTGTSNGYNILTQALFSAAAATDQLGVTVAAINILPLANNGGKSWTHQLNAGSIAVNAGDPLFACRAKCYDQRSVGFPRVLQSRVDVGAFESRY